MKTHAIGIFLVLSMLPSTTQAQQDASTSPPERASEQPATLNGQQPLLGEKSASRPNFLSTGVRFETLFDDNPLWATRDQHSNLSQVLFPYVEARHTASRLNWDFSLAAMLVSNRQLKTNNSTQESFQLNLSYRLTPHVTFRGSSEFANTSGLFSDFNTQTSDPGIGLIEQPRPSLFIPSNQREIWTSNLVELSDQTSPRGTVGIRGIYSLLNYPDVPQNSPFGLYNDQSTTGELFYNYHFSTRHWGGVMLRSEELETESQPSVRADGALLMYGFNLTPKITLSFFAGPQRLDAARILIRNQRWIPQAGGTFIWEGTKIGVLGEFSRGLTDGGGLFSPTIAQVEQIQLWRPLGTRRELDFGFTHSRADLLTTGEPSFGSSVWAQFEQKLTGNISAQVGYAREWQTYLENQVGTAYANRGWISLSYGITRTLGK